MEESCQITWDHKHHDAVILCVKDRLWTLAYGTTIKQARERAQFPEHRPSHYKPYFTGNRKPVGCLS